MMQPDKISDKIKEIRNSEDATLCFEHKRLRRLESFRPVIPINFRNVNVLNWRSTFALPNQSMFLRGFQFY